MANTRPARAGSGKSAWLACFEILFKTMAELYSYLKVFVFQEEVAQLLILKAECRRNHL